MFKQKTRGFSLMGVILITVLLASATAVIMSYVIRQSKQINQSVGGDYARSIAEMGVNMAQEHLQSDDDWSNNVGDLWTDKNVAGGALNVSITAARWDWCLVRSEATYGEESYVLTCDINLPVASEVLLTHAMNSYVYKDDDDDDGNDSKVIRDVTLRNTGINPDFPTVTINAMVVDWDGYTDQRIKKVSINPPDDDDDDDGNLWSGEADKGTVLALSPALSINTANVKVLSTLKFKRNIETTAYRLAFRTSDGSTVNLRVKFGTGSQASGIQSSKTEAYLDGNNKMLKNVRLTNSGSTAVSVIQMLFKWSSDQGEKVTKVVLRGKTVWAEFGPNPVGAQSSDYALDIKDVGLAAGESVTVNEIDFNSDISQKIVTMNLAFTDGSIASFNIWSPVGIVQSDYLKVVTSNARVNSKKIEGLTLQDLSSTVNISVTKMFVSWSPADSNKVKKIKLDNDTVWSGTASNGAVCDMDDTTLAAGHAAYDLDYIEFNSSSGLSSYAVTVNFIMGDATTKSVYFTPLP